MPTAAIKIDDQKMPAELLCESCGAAFFCGANTGECWCFAVAMRAEDLKNVREKFAACLCEKCLPQQKAHDIPEPSGLAENGKD